MSQNLQNLQNFAKFQEFQLDNLVDFEKCCKTRIFLQKSVPIQPKTSNILPKFCRSAVVSPTGARRSRRTSSRGGRRPGPASWPRQVSGLCAAERCGKLCRAHSRLYRNEILQEICVGKLSPRSTQCTPPLQPRCAFRGRIPENLETLLLSN